MTTPRVDLTAVQLRDFEQVLTWGDGDVDLSEHTAAMQVRRAWWDTETVLDLDGDNISLSESGDITITVPAASMDLDPREYVYDIRLTEPGGVEIPFCQGAFVVEPAVTRG